MNKLNIMKEAVILDSEAYKKLVKKNRPDC